MCYGRMDFLVRIVDLLRYFYCFCNLNVNAGYPADNRIFGRLTGYCSSRQEFDTNFNSGWSVRPSIYSYVVCLAICNMNEVLINYY